jgi:hypothetical protein
MVLGRLVGLGWLWGVARMKPIFVKMIFFCCCCCWGVGCGGSSPCEAG